MHHQKLLATIQTICKQHYCQQDRDSLRMSPTLQQLFWGCSAEAQLHSMTVALGPQKEKAKLRTRSSQRMEKWWLRCCMPAHQQSRGLRRWVMDTESRETKHTVMQVLLFLHADGHTPSLQLSLERASTHWPQINMS